MSRSVPNPETTRSSPDRVANALATGLGAGLVPVAPGTVGSVEGVAIFLAIRALNLGPASSLLVLAAVNVLVFAAGVWASNRSCKAIGVEDPRQVVIDEVSGQLIAITPLVFLPSFSITAVVVAFLLFRLFDIFKPFPIRKLERLPGGLGVMADDALAGIYAAAVLWISQLVHLI